MAISPPPSRTPLLDSKGLISWHWLKWLLGLIRQTGITADGEVLEAFNSSTPDEPPDVEKLAYLLQSCPCKSQAAEIEELRRLLALVPTPDRRWVAELESLKVRQEFADKSHRVSHYATGKATLLANVMGGTNGSIAVVEGYVMLLVAPETGNSSTATLTAYLMGGTNGSLTVDLDGTISALVGPDTADPVTAVLTAITMGGTNGVLTVDGSGRVVTLIAPT